MKTIPFASLLASLSLLAGCATDGPATNGDSVRAIFASQAVPAQPRMDRGLDARAAVAGYANYQQSYVTPAAQDSASAFGNK